MNLITNHVLKTTHVPCVNVGFAYMLFTDGCIRSVLKTRIHTLCRDIIAFKHNKIHQRIALVDCAIT